MEELIEEKRKELRKLWRLVKDLPLEYKIVVEWDELEETIEALAEEYRLDKELVTSLRYKAIRHLREEVKDLLGDYFEIVEIDDAIHYYKAEYGPYKIQVLAPRDLEISINFVGVEPDFVYRFALDDLNRALEWSSYDDEHVMRLLERVDDVIERFRYLSDYTDIRDRIEDFEREIEFAVEETKEYIEELITPLKNLAI